MPFAYNLFEVLELRNVSVIQMRKFRLLTGNFILSIVKILKQTMQEINMKFNLLVPFMKPSNQNLLVNNKFRFLVVDLSSDDVLNK